MGVGSVLVLPSAKGGGLRLRGDSHFHCLQTEECSRRDCCVRVVVTEPDKTAWLGHGPASGILQLVSNLSTEAGAAGPLGPPRLQPWETPSEPWPVGQPASLVGRGAVSVHQGCRDHVPQTALGSGGQKSEVKVWAGSAPPGREGESLPSLPASGGSLAVLGVLGFAGAAPWPLLLCSRGILPVCRSVCPNFSFPLGPPSYWIKTRPDDLVLT